MEKLRFETEKADQDKKKKELEEQNPGYGYGGKFGVQSDRMDKSAVGHDYRATVVNHASQKDYSDGFGGQFGVQQDRVDNSSAGRDHIENDEKHASQKDYAAGFGGKFGVQSDRADKSAVGWDHAENVEKHESQKGKTTSAMLKIIKLLELLFVFQIIQKVSVANLVYRKIAKTNQPWVGIIKRPHKSMRVKLITKWFVI